MGKRMISIQQLEEYGLWMYQNEKSCGTVKKYIYYLNNFREFLGERGAKKGEVMAWREYLRRHFAPVTVNGALAAANGFFRHVGWNDCCVRSLKIRWRTFCPAYRELSRKEYA